MDKEKFQKKLTEIGESLKIGEKKSQISEIEAEMQSVNFWNDAENSGKKVGELKRLKSEVEKFDDLLALSELADENDFPALEKEISELETLTYFSGKYDSHSAIINFYAGAGGDDAQDWTEMLMRMYLRWAENNNLQTKILMQSHGGIAGIKSATLEIDGDYIYGKLKKESGVHRLVRQSPFNAKSLRQTSFSLVEMMPKIEKEDKIEIPEGDLKIETFRSGGHGGQSVNTTDSAVRIIHIPTGISAICQNERSQLQNKESAKSVLFSRLAKLAEDQHKEKIAEISGEQAEPEWGSQIRSYILHPYKLVKDHRTEFSSTDPEAVLGGGIEGFLEAKMRK